MNDDTKILRTAAALGEATGLSRWTISAVRKAGRSAAHPFDAGQGAEPSRDGLVADPSATTQASTPSVAAAGVEYISVVELAGICGISSYKLDTQYRPIHWAHGAELHWNGRALCYAAKTLVELQRELHLAGQHEASLRLACWIDKRQHPAEPAVSWYLRGPMA